MEENILREAIQKLEETIGAKVVCTALATDQANDRLICLKVNKVEKIFQIEIKRSMNNATLALLAQKSKAEKQGTLLLASYVTPPIGEKLKSMGFQFLDTAGNAYLNFSQVFIFITGKKPVETVQPGTTSRAFKPKGLRIVFALLSNEKLRNTPFRTLAEAAKVSLGSVQWTIKDLQNLGYLIDMGKRGRRLIKKQELFKRWIQHYSEQLRPKLIVGRFRADNADWWQNTSIEKFDAFWGGEIAGAILTQNLKPELTTIYTHQPPGKLIAAKKLKKDNAGNIELLNTFWNPKFIESSLEVVHPFLVYADLASSGDERNIEIANQIYNEKIVELIRED